MIGNVRPVEDKSKEYRVADLSSLDSDWEKISEKISQEDTDTSDVSYQSKKTASTISLNSACRPSLAHQEGNPEFLKSATKELLLGLDRADIVDENIKSLGPVLYLQTTLSAKMSSDQVKIRTVVVENGSCLYDLMFISKLEYFDAQEKYFSTFVESLRLSK